MPYGLTVNGLVIKRLADIKDEIETAFKTQFGSGVNLQPQAPFGQIIGIHSERESLIWELLEAIYIAIDPQGSEGTPLERVCALVGVKRLSASYSKVTVTCTGTPTTVIPIGTVFSVSGNPTARFATDYEVTIEGGGTVDVECTAENAGAVIANAASLTVIETPVSGLDSVTNTLDAVVGRETETDAELRARRNVSLQQSNAGTLKAIEANVREVEDVLKCVGFENVTDEIDGDGRPPHSFEIVVQGGADEDIAQEIWEAKPSGIPTFGSEMETITDTSGINRDIYFSRAVEVDIHVEVDITRIEATSIPSEAQVKAKIIEYGATLGIGDDVLPIAGIIPKIAELSNIENISIAVDTMGAPVNDDPIAIAVNELAVFDTGRITVNFP